MEAWRIVVLVAMIAVFLIVTSATIWFCCLVLSRRGITRSTTINVGAKKASPDTFHFYDFDRRLCSINLSDYDGKPLHFAHDHMSVYQNNNNPTSTSIPMSPTQRSGTVAPPMPNGTTVVADASNATVANATTTVPVHGVVRYDMYNPDHFRMALAHATGERDYKTIAISRQDPGNVLVEIEVNDFLRRHKRDAHMRGTAESPCVLTRHFAFSRKPSMGAQNGGESYTPRDGQVTPRSHNVSRAPPSVMSAYTTRSQHHQNEQYLPVPLILPISPNITVNTPITFSSAYYLFVDDDPNNKMFGNSGGARFFQGSAGGGDTEESVVPSAIAERLEQLIAVDKMSGNYTVAPHATATINTKNQSAVIRYHNNNASPPRKVQRFIAPRCLITYSFEGPNQSIPYEPRNPVYLPAGRWSVCAKVSNEFGSDFRTQSRVFTVENTRY